MVINNIKYCSGTLLAAALLSIVPACDREPARPGAAVTEKRSVAGGESRADLGRPAGSPAHVLLAVGDAGKFGIEVQRAVPARIETSVELPGEVRPNADRLAHLVPRFEGIAIEVRKRIGDHVKQGEVLAVIESSESLSGYELRSLIEGTVIAKHITRGEAVSRETQAFIVADLGTVWVDLGVYQRDLERVRVGQAVVVSSDRGALKSYGTISYVTPVLDEGTRTATARVVISNTDGRWRPGMFVTGTVTVGSATVAVAVSQSAVQMVGGRSVVFVPKAGGFEPRPVELGRGDQRLVEIVEGLVEGDRYAARGSFILKSELEKSGLDAGHGQ